MSQRHFSRPRHGASANQSRIADGVVRRTVRPRAHQPSAVLQHPRHAVNARRLDGFLERHWRQDRRDALRQHGLPRARRPDEQNVVPAGDSHFDCPLDVALTFYVAKIDVVRLVRCEKICQIAARGQEREFAANKLKCLTQIVHAVDVDLFHHGSFACVGFRNEERMFPAPSRFQRDRQYAFDGAHGSIQRQLANETEFFKSRSVQLFADRDHPQRNRQIETRAFFFNIGRREIDGGPAARPAISTVVNSGPDAIPALFYGGVRQANDNHFWVTTAGVDLDFDLVCVHAVDSGRINFCEHGGRLGCQR